MAISVARHRARLRRWDSPHVVTSAGSRPPAIPGRSSARRRAACRSRSPACRFWQRQSGIHRVRRMHRSLLNRMRLRGLEPPRPYGHGDLNAGRLPIPPQPLVRSNLAGGRGNEPDRHIRTCVRTLPLAPDDPRPPASPDRTNRRPGQLDRSVSESSVRTAQRSAGLPGCASRPDQTARRSPRTAGRRPRFHRRRSMSGRRTRGRSSGSRSAIPAAP
jgi:hypothetical protein